MEWRSTINEFLDYLQHVKQSSANTVMAYRNDLSQLADFLSTTMTSDATWADVKPEHIDAYVAKLTSGNYTPSTTARKIAAMKTLFHWLSQDHGDKPRYVNEDPTVHLRSPKVQKRAPRLLTEEEVTRLFEAASKMPPPRSLRDRALLEVIYATGMRVSEASSSQPRLAASSRPRRQVRELCGRRRRLSNRRRLGLMPHQQLAQPQSGSDRCR